MKLTCTNYNAHIYLRKCPFKELQQFPQFQFHFTPTCSHYFCAAPSSGVDTGKQQSFCPCASVTLLSPFGLRLAPVSFWSCSLVEAVVSHTPTPLSELATTLLAPGNELLSAKPPPLSGSFACLVSLATVSKGAFSLGSSEFSQLIPFSLLSLTCTPFRCGNTVRNEACQSLVSVKRSKISKTATCLTEMCYTLQQVWWWGGQESLTELVHKTKQQV